MNSNKVFHPRTFDAIETDRLWRAEKRMFLFDKFVVAIGENLILRTGVYKGFFEKWGLR